MKKRLLLLACSFLYCAVAFSQHPHSGGGNPLYWALVGGIAAVLCYVLSLIFGNIKGVFGFFQRIMGKRKQVNNVEQKNHPFNSHERREEHQINTLSENLADASYGNSCNNEIIMKAKENYEPNSVPKNNMVSEPIAQNEKIKKKGAKRKTIIWIVLISFLLIVAVIGYLIYDKQQDLYEYHDDSVEKIKPLEEINRMMRLSGLSDSERELWYTVNNDALAKYSLGVREQVAQQIYENQLFVDKFGEEEFYKTAYQQGGAEIRRQQLKNKLLEEAWIEAFGPKHNKVRTPLDEDLIPESQ